MITVKEALSALQSTEITQTSISISLANATGYIMAENLHSPISMPPFRQSAMDGYAIAISNTNTYSLVGEIQAGDDKNFVLEKGEAVRIFTGAKVPDTANAVIMQEQVDQQERNVHIQAIYKEHQNIRALGEQIQKGNIALHKGTLLTSAAIGFLSSLGFSTVNVYAPPSVAIVITGNELVDPGEQIEEGQIFESNSPMLKSALDKVGIKEVRTYRVKDDYESTLKHIKKAIKENDMVLISGGISVGNYDFVKQALMDLQTKEVFYKIKQKPGKPLFFGMHQQTPIFALPGNPASSLTCFYMYVLPLIQRYLGVPQIGLPRVSKISKTAFIKKGDRAQFLKAFAQENQVEILEGQSSAMLHTFAIANALIYIPEDRTEIREGELVETIMLPV